MIRGMMTRSHTAPGPATTDPAAASPRAADDMIAATAAAWLTPDTVTVIGHQVAASITAYRRGHGRSPTWAEALAGIDPALLTPMTTPPPGWPQRPAMWRRQLRIRMMTELRHTRWITYTPTPRSLRAAPDHP